VGKRLVVAGVPAVAAVLLAGCSAPPPTPEEVVMERVKEKHQDAEWYSHVTDWDAAIVADLAVQTDYDYDNADDYPYALAICDAVLAEVADDAKSELLLRVYGVELVEETQVDGSVEVTEDNEMMAQMSDIWGSLECGVTPPAVGDAADRVEAMGLPEF
jgi:hypothetical protein